MNKGHNKNTMSGVDNFDNTSHAFAIHRIDNNTDETSFYFDAQIFEDSYFCRYGTHKGAVAVFTISNVHYWSFLNGTDLQCYLFKKTPLNNRRMEVRSIVLERF